MTKIEWCDDVWNPVTGCSPISAGCAHCYAKRMAQRLKGRFGYPEDEPFKVTFHPDRLDQPSKWKKPSKIFVCSMGDLFHEDVPKEWIDTIFWRIGFDYIYHTFLILTKRPHRMKEYFDRLLNRYGSGWPNLWLGISAENQQTLDDRASILLQIPAAKRFVSLEPMLGPVDLCVPYGQGVGDLLIENLSWIIVGGLSLPGGKVVPPVPEWIDDIVEQCDKAGVPLFIKDNARHYTRYALQPERREFPA